MTELDKTCDQPQFLLEILSLPPLWVLGFLSLVPLFPHEMGDCKEAATRWQRGLKESTIENHHEISSLVMPKIFPDNFYIGNIFKPILFQNDEANFCLAE